MSKRIKSVASTSGVLLIVLSLFVNTDYSAGPSITEEQWHAEMMLHRMSPVSGTPEETRLINSARGIIQLSPTKIVVREPSAPHLTRYISPPSSGYAGQIFRNELTWISNWQKENAGKTVKLVVKNGVYRFDTRSKIGLHILNMNQLIIAGEIINGQRPVLIFEDNYRTSIVIEDSKFVRLSSLEVTYDRSLLGKISYRGKVYSADTIIVPELPFEYAPKMQAIRSFDSRHNVWFNHGSPTVKRKSVFVHDIHEALDGALVYKDLINNQRAYKTSVAQQFQIGEDILVIHDRGNFGGGIVVTGVESSDITISQMFIHDYPQMALRVHNAGRGFKLEKNHIAPVNDILSGRADAIHVTGVQGDVIIDGNVVLSPGDDGLNLRGTDITMDAVSRAGEHVKVTGQFDRAGFLAAGDRVALIAADGLPVAFARAVSYSHPEISFLPDAGCVDACLDALVTKLQPSSTTNSKARIYSITRASMRYSVRNNRMLKPAGRGIIVQTPNGEVVNNFISFSSVAGVLAGRHDFQAAESTEGLGPINLLIEGNRIHGAGNMKQGTYDDASGAISITARSDRNYDFKYLQRILVRGNCISDSGFSGVRINRATRVEVSNNTMSGLNRNPVSLGATPHDPIYSTLFSRVFDDSNIMTDGINCLLGPDGGSI